MELVSPASHCSNKPQNTHRNPRQVEVCPSLEASTSSQGRAGLQKLSASHNIFPHLQSFIPESFPNRGTDSFQLQHRTMNSDRTWKRASCPNICSSSPQKQHLHRHPALRPQKNLAGTHPGQSGKSNSRPVGLQRVCWGKKLRQTA